MIQRTEFFNKEKPLISVEPKEGLFYLCRFFFGFGLVYQYQFMSTIPLFGLQF
ncbi:MAG: hypothetical protein ACI8P7_000523, partial [Candidatus Azotimanducaceae bacterium]